MPGVHHKYGVWIASGEKLPHRQLPLLNIEQGGALIYSLMGLPIPDDIEIELPKWLDTILATPRGTLDNTSHASSAPVYTEASSVLDRLHAMGYLD